MSDRWAVSDGWVGPDVAAEPPRSLTANPSAADVAESNHVAASTLPPPPLALVPSTLPDILDGAFTIIKRRPRDVFLLAVMFVIPVEILSVVVLRDVLGEAGIAGLVDPSAVLAGDGSTVGSGAMFAGLAASTVSLALLTGAMAILVDGWFDGRHVSAGAAAIAALRRSHVLLLAALLVKVCEGVGLIAVGLGAYVAMALCHVVSPVAALERGGPVHAVVRAMRLTRPRLGSALVLPAQVGLVGLLIGFGLQAIPTLATAVTPAAWDWLVLAMGQIASQLIVVPFTAGVAVLFHLDLRMRVEGFDLEARLDAIAR